MSDRRYLSVSQIEMFGRCELQWYHRYVLGLKRPPGVAAVIGKGTHKAIEIDLRWKMAWHSLIEDEAVKAHAADATRAAWEKEPPAVNPGDPDQGEAIDIAVGLATLHHKVLAPKIEPIAIEQAFKIELPQLDHDLVGVLDIETPTHVRDTKTKGRAPSWDAARRSTQLVAYHLHTRLAGPHIPIDQGGLEPYREPKAVALDFLVKKRFPEVVTVEAQPTPAEHIAFVKRVELTSKAIGAGIFRPTNPDNWCCTEKWCGYWDECDHGAKKKITVGLIDPARLTSKLIPHPHADTQDDPDATP
jgi:hypothetical protein